ncbi:MAG: hypothetical protein ACO1NX_11040 [Chitinophagaceae bacterium]
MRKTILLLTLTLFTATTFGQQQPDAAPAPDYDYYIKKSKTQKAVGWILTVAGTGGLIATLSADVNQSIGGAFVTIFSAGTAEPEYKSYTGYYVLGGAALAGGIVCFSKAGKNRQKAKALQTSFKMEKAPVLYSNGMGSKANASLALSVSL